MQLASYLSSTVGLFPRFRILHNIITIAAVTYVSHILSYANILDDYIVCALLSSSGRLGGYSPDVSTTDTLIIY